MLRPHIRQSPDFSGDESIRPQRVLLVEPDSAFRTSLLTTAAQVGIDGHENFPSAKAHLLSVPCRWLVTNIRLAGYNGLHLVHLARSLDLSMHLLVYEHPRPRPGTRGAAAWRVSPWRPISEATCRRATDVIRRRLSRRTPPSTAADVARTPPGRVPLTAASVSPAPDRPTTPRDDLLAIGRAVFRSVPLPRQCGRAYWPAVRRAVRHDPIRRTPRIPWTIPVEVEEFRDQHWRREATRQVDTAFDAERFVEEVGFAACLTDSRRPGPSLYVAVCGRRDAVLPRNVQKDAEASLTWQLKDEVVRRGRVYYAKLARGKAMFLAPRMVPHFHAVWGVRRSDERRRLSTAAQAILRVLRGEWEMATADLRDESGVNDRQAFSRGMDELQAAMIVVPSEVLYRPRFTYLWTLGVGRFPEALTRRVRRQTALREIARAFLAGAGMTVPGELARVTGLPRPDAGLGHRALVAEGYAISPARGVYQLAAGHQGVP